VIRFRDRGVPSLGRSFLVSARASRAAIGALTNRRAEFKDCFAFFSWEGLPRGACAPQTFTSADAATLAHPGDPLGS
jgi:hypothetical protein